MAQEHREDGDTLSHQFSGTTFGIGKFATLGFCFADVPMSLPMDKPPTHRH